MIKPIVRAASVALLFSASWSAHSFAGGEAAPRPDTASLLRQIDAATRAGRLVQADAMLTWLEQNDSKIFAGAVALHRAELSMVRGDVSSAVAALDRVGVDDGSICRKSTLTGWIAGKSAEWNKAILKLAEAIQQCGDDASLWNLLGLALLGKGEHAAGLEAFDSALILQPQHAGLLNNRALALVGVQKHGAALADLQRALDIAPNDLSIRNNADYLSGLLGVAPIRRENESDAIWAARLIRAGEGARDAGRSSSAMAHFANAALLSDRFDMHIWAQGALPQGRKAD